MNTLFQCSTDRRREEFTSRRGVLLLVVLSMLTLFMMLGVAYVIMASRARDTSRAFSRAVTQQRFAERGDRELLEQALLLLVRGPDPLLPLHPAPRPRQPGELKTASDVAVTPLPFPFSFESLLEDMYGSEERLTGKTLTEFDSAGPICSVEIGRVENPSTGTQPAGPLELSGRIISFLRDSGRITSHRILRVEPTEKGYRLFIANHGDVFRSSRPPSPKGPVASTYDFPPSGTDILINGRAHSGLPAAGNESWDGYDFEDDAGDPTNPFLARVEPVPSTPSASSVVRFSMFNGPGPATSPVNTDLNGDSIPDYCDNDGDGVLDGQFFDPGFQPIAVENGAERRVDISCLIVDLDGRVNVNAHGSLAAMLYPPGSPNWPASLGVTDPIPDLPPGSGYGPAEINLTMAFDDLMTERSFKEPDDFQQYDRWFDPSLSISGGAMPQKQYAASLRASQPEPECRIAAPLLGPLEGRYGELARSQTIDRTAGDSLENYQATTRAMPGETGVNDNAPEEEQFRDPISGQPARPIDLHGRLKHRMVSPSGSSNGVVPVLEFIRPDDPTLVDDLTDDPYEIDLVSAMAGGKDANPRTGGLTYSATPRDNRFSIAELERVLRPYDADSFSLPQRLFTLLGPQAEVGRLLCTTESWSIPAITGEASELLFGPNSWWQKVWEEGNKHDNPDVLSSTVTSITEPKSAESIPDGLMPADIAAGLKLDVAPVLHTNLHRRALFKDLYLLGVAMDYSSRRKVDPATSLNPDRSVAAKIAQWAANVVEFQDADSAMTLYEYDPDPGDGWNVDGDPDSTSESPRAVVWGGERPDVIITQALAWENSSTNDGGLYFVLHRPLKSTIMSPADDPNSPPAAEPIDPNLSGPQPDQIDLGRLSKSGTSPIWRVGVKSGGITKILRFDDELGKGAPGGNELGARDPDPNGQQLPFGPHEWLCVMPSSPGGGVTVAPELKEFKVDIGTLKAETLATEVELRLERLADPTYPEQPDETQRLYNPYLVVDAATVKVLDQYDAENPTTSRPLEKSSRDGWARITQANSAVGDNMTAEWPGDPEWFPWPDRPLIGITELLFVPGWLSPGSPLPTYRPLPANDPDSRGLFDNYSPPSGFSFLPDPRILEVVRVPSRYSGTRISVTMPPVGSDEWKTIRDGLARLGVSTDIRRANQIDLGREPGRVNLNTISSDAAWKAVVQGGVLRNEAEANVDAAPKVPGRLPAPDEQSPDPDSPRPANFSASPARRAADLLALTGSVDPESSSPPYEDSTDGVADADINPWHRLATATRLSNMATDRSHVFGIWITLRTIDYFQDTTQVSRADPNTVRYSRMFVIYDRSKPVAFDPGKDHNVADGILLRRVLP